MSELAVDIQRHWDDSLAEITRVTGQLITDSNVLVSEIEDVSPWMDSMMGYMTEAAIPEDQIGEPTATAPPGNVDPTKHISTIRAQIGAEPAPFVYQDGIIGGISPQTFTTDFGTAPEYVDPNQVAPQTFTAPNEPVILPVETLDPLSDGDLIIPDPPVLTDITVPDAPEFAALPEFTYTIPGLEIEAPEPTLNWSESAYLSEIFDAAKEKLLYDFEHGGTGLADSVEQGIFNRARAREIDEQRRNLVQTADEFAAGGFPMPPGALQARMRTLRKDIQNRSEAIAREILIAQADLAQKNTHFTMEQALQADGQLREHHHRVSDRMLQAAKTAVEYAITVYNAKVTAHNLKLEQFKAEVAVYEIKVRGAFHAIEYHKAELSAAQIRGELRGQELQKYLAELQGVDALVRIHTARMDQAKIAIENERLKLGIYQSQIEAYVAKIKGKESEYANYRAQIEGERAKVEGYKIRVDGISEANRAKLAIVEAEKTVMLAKAENQQLIARSKQMELDAYIARSRAVLESVDVAIKEYQANASAYVAEAGLEISKAQVKEQFNARLQEVNRRVSDVLNKKFAIEKELEQTYRQMKITGYDSYFAKSIGYLQALLNQFVNITKVGEENITNTSA